MKIVLIAFIIVFSWKNITAQELNSQVSVQANPALTTTTTEREVFSEIELAVTNLINETVWGNDRFEVEERINCNFQISITEVTANGGYKATLQVQATRPVFNSTYNTTLLNLLDENVYFTFKRGASLIYSENQFTENLSSVIAFYANYILGLDGDSFSLRGGDPYLRKAQSIVMLAQSSMSPGWKSDERGRNNRFWLIDNALHELFSPLRECFYDYHRKGLDRMYDNQNGAREEMKNALDKLSGVNSARPGSVNLLNFIRSKRDEIANIFKEADRKQQTEIVNLLKRIDPTNASMYQEIIQ